MRARQLIFEQHPRHRQPAGVADGDFDFDPPAGLDFLGGDGSLRLDAVQAFAGEQPGEEQDAEQDVGRVSQQSRLDDERQH